MINKIDIKIENRGRLGYINYQDGKYKILIEWEMSGSDEYDKLLAPLNLKKWTEPKEEKIEKVKQLEILSNIQTWLQNENIKTDINLPVKIEFENKNCIFSRCTKKRLKKSMYCLEHYNENLLVN